MEHDDPKATSKQIVAACWLVIAGTVLAMLLLGVYQ